MSTRQRIDLVAFVMGLLLAEVAIVALWNAFGSVDWRLLGIAAPLTLVVIGGIGLLFSRTPRNRK